MIYPGNKKKPTRATGGKVANTKNPDVMTFQK
jgi:hypothetical protein